MDPVEYEMTERKILHFLHVASFRESRSLS